MLRIVILGHLLQFWLWIFVFLFLAVLAVNSIVRSIKGDYAYKAYGQQYVGMGLVVVLAAILHYTYPFGKFWKELQKALGL